MVIPKDSKRYKKWKRNLRLAWKDPKRRRLMSKILRERKFSKETIKKISEFAKTRTGKKNSFFGKHHTEEAKRKIGLANKGINSARYGKKPWNKGKIYDEKIRRKMSETAK